MMAIASFSQSIGDLPATSVIIHYKLSIGYNTTTILIFPSAVQQVDRGERDLMAQKQAGVQNVLKLKADRKDFPPTNLHVFTADGRVYAFDVVYVPDPKQTTFDLTKLATIDSSNATGQIELSTKPLDRQKLARDIAKVKAAQSFLHSRCYNNKMEARLQAIYRADDMLYFNFKISNRSNLPYRIDFAHLIIRDKQKIKRGSIQEREIVPIFSDTIACVPNNSTILWVVAIPQLTIPEGRKIIWEMYEKNGGRHLLISFNNRELYKARITD